MKKTLLLMLLMVLIAPWAMNAQNSIPFNEGFESMTSADDLTAAGWELSTTESGTFLAIETTAANVYEGSKSLNLDAWNASSSSSVQYLGLPLMDGDLSTLQISFAYKVSSGTINVGYLTDETDFSTFVSLAQYSSSSSFTVKTTDLSEAPKDAVRLVIKYTGWYRCYLDSFEVTPAPTCEAATSITASDITATSATIAWEGEGDTWNLKYNGTVVNGIAAMTYNLTGLTDGTNYTVSVQNVCDDGTTTDWISTTFRTTEICPENTVCIGEGTATNSYLPTYAYYKNSLTQQIYTADELGEAGAIESIAFYSVQANTKSRTFDFYMVATDKDAFSSTTDWIAVTSADLVGSATVTLKEGWNTFELDNPFVYDGSSNVALIIDATASEYESGITFYVYDAPSSDQAIRVYSDATDYDPTAPSSYTGTLLSVKNRLRVVMGEPPACPKPTSLTVNYEGGTEATLSWTSDATSFNIDVNGVVTNNVTSPYTLSNLELATTYEVMVQANCGGGELSEWTNPVSFHTDFCAPEDMCAITFDLVDSYGDGWNGAAIQVYDYDTTTEELTLLGEFTVPSSSNSANYTLNVCDGRYLVFFWSSGSYDSECSYTVYDNVGDPIFSGSGAMSDYEIFLMNCNSTCRMPTDFAASEITGRSVELSWTENGEATEWTIYYMAATDTVTSSVVVTTNPYTLEGLTPTTTYYAIVVPTCEVEKQSDVITWTTTEACPKPVITVDPILPNSATVSWTGLADDYEFEWAETKESNAKDGTWLQYDDGTISTNYGLGTSFAEWTYGAMYPSSMLGSNTTITKMAFYENSYMTNDVVVNIYSGGDEAPGTLLHTQNVILNGTSGMHEVELDALVTIDPSENLWITITVDASNNYVFPCNTGEDFEYEENNDWIAYNGNWYHWKNLVSSGTELGWLIRGYVELGIDFEDLDWQTVAGATSPYVLEDLEPETTYVVRIKALCGGEDGESGWSMVTFTTPSPCAAPTNLAAEPTATTADLSWFAYSDTYTLRYRHTDTDATLPATIILEAHDVWEDGSGYQMLLDATHSLFGDVIPVSGPLTASGSCETTPANLYDAFTYTIPENADPSCDPEIFVFDTIVTLQIPAGLYDWCIVNPSAGDRIWIAGEGDIAGRYDDYLFEAGVTYHFTMGKFGSGDGAALEIDRPLSDWITVENITNPYTLTGLTPTTYYEWQVQGVNPNCGEGATEWSDAETFFTTELTTPTQTIALTEGSNWFSTYLDITLNDLKAALVEAFPDTQITIKAKSGSTGYNPNNHRWTGNITFDVATMYVIQVPTSGTLTLEGELLEPADHPITIKNGTNWIGFPLSENTTLTDAFAGFAVSGDQVKSKSGNAGYNGRRWNGTFTELEPGKGYRFISTQTDDRTLVFPSVSRKSVVEEPTMNNVVLNKVFKTIDNELEFIDLNLDRTDVIPTMPKAMMKNNHRELGIIIEKK